MLEFLLFMVAVILAVKFWRIFLPLGLVALVLGGLFVAGMLGAFRASLTQQEIAASCHGTDVANRPRVTEEQCAKVDRDDAVRYAGLPLCNQPPVPYMQTPVRFTWTRDCRSLEQTKAEYEAQAKAEYEAEQRKAAAAVPPPVQAPAAPVKAQWVNPCPAPLLPLYGTPNTSTGYLCLPKAGDPWPEWLAHPAPYVNPYPKAG